MILDTNALSAFLLADPKLLRIIPDDTLLSLPVIVLGEYRFGLSASRDGEKLGLLLDQLEDCLDVIPVDARTVRPYARIRRQMQAAGTPIPQNDAWIAALAMQHRVPVISRDTHFDTISGIRRVSW